MYWRQKSRKLWLTDGDKNTKYLYASTKKRRTRNRITGLFKKDGICEKTEDSLESMATNYFQMLFASSLSWDPSEVIQEVHPVITEKMNRILTLDISEEEVKKALFSMHSKKSPGPDGMTILFYQRFWATIKGDLVGLLRNFFVFESF